MIQKSYSESEYGKLYLIPTPIGNLDDITYRAINTLRDVDMVFAEDTRVTINLLKHFDISKKVESCHKYTEMKNKDKIINILKSGKNIGYVTDRGTPLISDPGNVIVDAVIEENITVIALPGSSALLPALNMSGISNERFLFYGFLQSKSSLAKKELIDLKEEKYSIILYESPHRILNTLELIFDVFGDRKIAVVREISKLYEEVIRGRVSEVISLADNIRGEIVLVIEGNNNIEDNNDYEKLINELIDKGYSKRDAVKEIAERYNVSKNKLYNMVKEN
ncbi:MAG: 16S rRNA (cytidine(1402)-2'-O)-methyltransferase [Bacilli bacterium]|nr:16S rRNA (cytidine(1402)-2'-O)-methyltransferase [Bacilli bacterium]